MAEQVIDEFPEGTYAWLCQQCEDHHRVSHSANKDPNKRMESRNPCDRCEEWTEFVVDQFWGEPQTHWGAEDGERVFADGYPKPVEEVVDLDAAQDRIDERRRSQSWGPDPWG